MTKKGENRPIESEQLVILKNAVAMAKYDLSRNQQKVFLEVAMMAKNQPDEKFYKLYIREFLKNINVSSNDTADLKREIEEMRSITIHIPKTKRGGELKANFFASVEIFEGNRYVEIELSEKLKPYFIEIAEGDFFHYQIENTRVLKSNHSIRMYLYLKAWRWTGRVVIRYDELRGILGVKEGDYKLFGDFKKRVLDKAQLELAAKTDLSFTYTLIRERANNPNSPVHKIAFTILDNGKTPAITSQQPEAPQIVIPLSIAPDEELVNLAHQIEKIAPEELGSLIGSYGRERVHDVLVLATEEHGRGNRIRSLAAYLHNALRNNSAQGKSSQGKKKSEQQRILLEHREIESLISKGITAFKGLYYRRLGESATQPVLDTFCDTMDQEMRLNPALKKIYLSGADYNTDAMRLELGRRLNQQTEDELACTYLASCGKPIQRISGFWQYIR
ncbi:replication initiation protein [Fibrella forsythiae]|uniref:Replication initiation protein n=1 Tax=Fibrella forsythiae TaxID=2817061 RepID=A0ABS3JUV7_9BACT|nr:replication initiation protein [Fibrella forsythiae]MBO0952979.1 replication initiation protein [Fibrella forsythiae]